VRPVTFPLAIAFAIAPSAVVLQSKSLAPIATLALLACVGLHWRRTGRLPWPRGALAAVALALFGWAAITALWAIEPLRALGTSVQIGAFVALGAAAARAVAGADDTDQRRFALTVAVGLALGLVVAGLDAASGNAIRAAVRGLKEPTPGLVFGLKPAASAIALWLPLVAAVPGLPRWLRAGGLLAGAAVLLLLPGESARLAVLAGAVAGATAWAAPRLAPRALGGTLALAILLMPAVLGPILAKGIRADGLAPSAAHRLLIWDFVGNRIAEHPLRGWGMEASRQIPGAKGPPAAEQMARFGLDGPASPEWLRGAELLPLHPHNLALQLWLELGLPGALLGAALAWLLGLAAAASRWPAVATAVYASGAVTALLSFGAWQEWWVGAELLAVAAIAALPRPTQAGGSDLR
jgi:O-antigen ligase